MSKASFLILCSLAGVGHGIRQTTGRMEVGVMSFLIVCLLAIVTAVRHGADRVEFGVTVKQFGQQWKESNQSSRSGQIELNEDELGEAGEEVLEGTAVEVLEDPTGANPSCEVELLEAIEDKVAAEIKNDGGLHVLRPWGELLLSRQMEMENFSHLETPCSNLHSNENQIKEASVVQEEMIEKKLGADLCKLAKDFLGEQTFGCHALAFAQQKHASQRLELYVGNRSAVDDILPHITCDEQSEFVPNCGCESCTKLVREEIKANKAVAAGPLPHKEVHVYAFVMDGCCIPKKYAQDLDAKNCCQIL